MRGYHLPVDFDVADSARDTPWVLDAQFIAG